MRKARCSDEEKRGVVTRKARCIDEEGVVTRKARCSDEEGVVTRKARCGDEELITSLGLPQRQNWLLSGPAPKRTQRHGSAWPH